MGPADSPPQPDSPTDSSSELTAPTEPDPYEKWLVRILLGLAFGLAFGIEGMTLIRSFVIDPAEPDPEQASANARPTLEAGDALVPSVAPGLRAHRLRIRATSSAWTFTVAARPDPLTDGAVTVTFDRLTLDNGEERTSAPRHTWAPPDTATFTASWTLPVGRRPTALTVTATADVGSDSTASATRTVNLGHVPVRQQ